MYRAWQRRRAERGSSGGRSRGVGAAEAEPSQAAPAVAIPNATDAFYARLTAALEASAFEPEGSGNYVINPLTLKASLEPGANERG